MINNNIINLNKNNPIEDFNYYKGKIPAVRYDEGSYLRKRPESFPEVLERLGLLGSKIRITSGHRKPGEAGNAGARSNHTKLNKFGLPYAYDIVPVGMSFTDLDNLIRDNAELLLYLMDNNYRIIREDTADAIAKYGSTGRHWHLSYRPGSTEGTSFRDYVSEYYGNKEDLQNIDAVNDLEDIEIPLLGLGTKELLHTSMTDNTELDSSNEDYSNGRPTVILAPVEDTQISSTKKVPQEKFMDRYMKILTGVDLYINKYIPLYIVNTDLNEDEEYFIPSSNSVKPNLFYGGGDTMTSQFLDQVLADREAELQRKEELASLNDRVSPFYDGYTEAGQLMNNSSKPNIFRRSDGSYFYSANGKDEVDVTPVNTLLGNPSEWTYTDDNGRLYTPKSINNNNLGVITQSNNEGPIVSAVNNYLRELLYKWDNNIPIDGKYTMPAIAASALLPLAGTAFANTTLAGIPATTWADAALTAGFGAHGLNHATNEGIDGWGDAAMTAMEIAPLGGLVKPMWNAGRESYSVGNRYFKGLFNKTKKAYKRFTEEPPAAYSFNSEYDRAMNKIYTPLAHEKADYPVYISKKEKDAFRKMYARQFKYSPASEVDTFDYSVFNYTDEEIERLKALFKHNPEYFVHVKDTDISNPLSQDAVDGFINRQLTSMRGVTAPNKETAIPYLTTTERDRYMRGGDRLSTNGGLYTTNNPVVSDRFKNPIGEINNNGYVGILKEPDTINRTLSIEDLLRQLRNRTEFGDDLLEGTPYIHNLDRSNAKMFEASYVGRASRGTGGYERAYLPTGKLGEVTSPVQLQSLEEYLNQADQHGRWGHSLDVKINPDLFIAKQLNGYDDYIRRARAVLKPRKETDWDVFNVEYNRLYEPAAQRLQRRRDLTNKAYDKHRTYIEMKSQAPWILGMSSPLVGLFGYASYLRDENARIDELVKKYTENGMLRYGEDGEPMYVLTDKGKINTPSDLSQLVEDFKERHQRRLERNQSRNQEKKLEYSLGGHLNKFEEGGNTDDYKYQAFLEDLKNHAPNLAAPSRNYNMRRYWELRGKPSNWAEALRDFNYLYNVKEDPMFTLENDGAYHAPSTAFNLDTGIYEFMKSADHPTVKYELNWYDNGDETGPNGLRIPSFEGFKYSLDFKQNYELKYSPIENKYYYIPKQR